VFAGPASGLWTNPNPFNVSPAGSLAVADNVMFTAPGVVEPRRGMSLWANATFGTSDSRGRSLAPYLHPSKGTLWLLQYDTDKLAVRQGSGSFIDFTATFTPPSTKRMRFMGAAKSIFFNTTGGIFDYDSVGQPYMAGCPQGLNALAQLSYGDNGWMVADSAVAYCFTICQRDSFGRVIEGPPSGRVVVRNPLLTVTAADGGTMDRTAGVVRVLLDPGETPTFEVGDQLTLSPGEADFPSGVKTVAAIEPGDPSNFAYVEAGVDASFSTPETFSATTAVEVTCIYPNAATVGVSTNNFLKVYRTQMSVTADTLPSDEFFQVYETPYLSAADVAAGQLSFTDITPEGFIAGNALPLYTNPDTGDGADQANYRPPLARDMTYWGDRAWFADTENLYSLSFTLVGTGTPDGVQAGDTLNIYTPALGIVLGQFVVEAVSGTVLLDTPGGVVLSTLTVGGSLAPGTYGYRVSALNGYGGETVPSAEVSILVPAGTSTNTVTVKWNPVYMAPAVGAPGYNIYGRTLSGEQLLATNVPWSPAGWVDTGAVTPSGDPPLITTSGPVFQVFTDGDPGTNIEMTALDLVRCINQSPFNSQVYARYTSSATGLPGNIRLEARYFGDSQAFELFASRSTSWSPQPPPFSLTPSWTPPTADNNRHAAGLWYSKLRQPEAVPPVNYMLVNTDNEELLRAVFLNYRLLLFKPDGIYFTTNVAPYPLQKLSEYKLIAPDSIAVFEDTLYALTDQGVISISDAGCEQASIPIDDQLVKLFGPASLSDVGTETLGIAYRSARQYLLWLLEQDGSSFTEENSQAFVYSTLAKGYTRYTFGAGAAAVDPVTNQLVVAPTDRNQLLLENKTFTLADYTDVALDGTFVSVSGDQVVVTSSTGIVAGDAITYDNGLGAESYLVLSIDGNTLTTLGSTGWTPAPGAAYVINTGYECEVLYNKLTGGKPATMKVFQQASFLFRTNTSWKITALFQSESQSAVGETEMEGRAWGKMPWGESAWGAPCEQVRRIDPLPLGYAEAAQLSPGFKVRQAFAGFQFLGVDLVMKQDTEANRGR
jgi:hypothetical protein